MSVDTETLNDAYARYRANAMSYDQFCEEVFPVFQRMHQKACARLGVCDNDVSEFEDQFVKTACRLLKGVENGLELKTATFSTYVFKSFTTSIFNGLRSIKRDKTYEQSLPEQMEIPDKEPSPLERCIQRQRRERFERALKRLNGSTRKTYVGELIQHFVCDEPYSEIASKAGLPETTIRSGVNHTKILLAEALRKERICGRGL